MVRKHREKIMKLKLYTFCRPDEKLPSASAKDENTCQILELKYLPPIVLNFNLTSLYPSEEIPIYKLSCKWLTTKQVRIWLCSFKFYKNQLIK